MTKILIIGSGAREHIIAEKLAVSTCQVELYYWGTHFNPGIKELCVNYQTGSLKDSQSIVIFAQTNQIDFAVIGPELPLSTGLVDHLTRSGVACIGPTQALAEIESSKGFTRELLKKYNIAGSPRYYHCHTLTEAKQALNQLGDNYVVKANGLMGGKGVKLSGEHLNSTHEALAFCESVIVKHHSVVIEEKLEGEEFSLLSFVAGPVIQHMPAVQDYKRAFVNNEGPNTGGMGTYSDSNHRLPFLSESDIVQAQQTNTQVALALQEECQETYCGILYGSYMKTADGIKVIEYNARFGDPEALNLLTLLETDLVMIFQSMLSQQLDQLPIHFAEQATVCKYLVPNGYPENPVKDQPIVLDELPEQVLAYFGAIDQQHDELLMTGSRALALIAKAPTIAEANKLVEEAIPQVSGDCFHREDVGSAELINQSIEHINQLCHEDNSLL